MNWIVLKFGGTSVSSRERWETIARVTRDRIAAGYRPLVVVSAVRGVSDTLDGLLEAAVRGEKEAVLARVRAVHRELGRDLGLDAEALLSDPLEELERLALGAQLTGETTARLRARVMAMGELLLSRLGAAWLTSIGVETAWLDARTALLSRRAQGERAFLSATCDHAADPALAARLAALPGAAVMTQGFIACNAANETVLLGRGGSDTSAAYLAARLLAERCEIWTDVPGMFTANPRSIPQARLLRALSYDEAQEIATMGAKVLHPRCIAPVREHRIPLHVLSTLNPGLEGTVVGGEAPAGAQIKAISSRRGITLVSMDTVGMWQQVGFLADAFAIFKAHGLSIDLVSTSETNVTVSLDPSANSTDPATLEALLADLGAVCRARVIGPCASISLVGQGVRSVLHRLGPALALFEEQRIHLLTQAASDLNLTFVVDEEQEDRLVRELHELLFRGRQPSPAIGPTWRELYEGPAAPSAGVGAWWQAKREALLGLGPTPLYVYDAETVDRRAAEVASLADRAFYAIKANPHPELLRRIAAAGIGLECVSPGELAHVFDAVPGLAPDRVLFTPNFAPREEYEGAFARGVHVTVDDVYPLEAWPETFRDREIFVRLDPGRGRGHHEHVRTAGASSKFGVSAEQLDRVVELVALHGTRVVGLHAHAGSGIRTPDNWREVALFLAQAAERFPGARILDLGGGFGVPERPGDERLDLDAVRASLAAVKAAHPGFALWVEPGRYLVAEAGVLLARVTQVKRKGELTYVGVDAGMNSLIRPALYGAFHEIVNLTRLDAPRTLTANVVGPICESGDTLGYARLLAPTEEGDVLLIATAGAYGHAMSSRYNLREPAAEVVI